MSSAIAEMDNGKLLISPSILAADFANLGADVALAEKAEAEMLHVDVMDGHFVPNISIGPPVVASLRKATGLPLDVHLMISDPLRYVPAFAKAGADHITFHIESDSDPDETIKAVRDAGLSVGVSVKPATPASEILGILPEIDMLLVMTVEPGFGGQSFMADMLPKIREIRAAIDKGSLGTHVEVDGGIDAETAPLVREAGANVLVAGTSVFRHPEGVEAAIAELRNVCR
jgi:ribulose-phosphate 3-epimerase